MAVKLEGQHPLEAPREVVWQALNDPDILARTLPGCEQLAAVGENRYEGTLNLRVGPVQGKFQGTVELSEIVPPESYHLSLKGSGPAGFVEGSGAVRLTDREGGGTVLHYEVDTQVGGRIAGVGQRLLDSSARVITRQTLDGLGKQVEALAVAAGPGAPEAGAGGADEEEGASGGRTVAPPAAPAAPSQAEFAAGFARGMLAELIPRERRPLVFGVAALVLLVAVFLLARACGG